MKIDAVAFDVDGTLYPRALMYRLSVRLALSYPRFVYHFNRARRAVRRLSDIGDFRRTQAALVAAGLGIAVETASALVERIIYREWEDMLSGIRPFPGVRCALDRLRGAGLRLGVMSDYPVTRKLEFLGLQGLWDTSFCSEETGTLKPHPNAFRRLARDLRTDAARILYVGDDVRYDIGGAMSAGMRAARFGREAAGADFAFSSYAELFDLICERYL